MTAPWLHWRINACFVVVRASEINVAISVTTWSGRRKINNKIKNKRRVFHSFKYLELL